MKIRAEQESRARERLLRQIEEVWSVSWEQEKDSFAKIEEVWSVSWEQDSSQQIFFQINRKHTLIFSGFLYKHIDKVNLMFDFEKLEVYKKARRNI